VVNASIKKEGRSQINNLTLHFKGLEKRKSKLRRGKEIIKIIAEIKQRNKVNRKKKIN